MTEIQEVEIERHRKQMYKDMQHLVEKYARIMDWDVPENDEASAHRLIIAELRSALLEVESKI